MAQSKIRSRLNRLTLERQGIEQQLGRTGEELRTGAELLVTSLELSRDPHALYRRSPDEVCRSINETFFDCFYIDAPGEVVESRRRKPFDEFGAALAAYHRSSVARLFVGVQHPDTRTPQRR